MLWDDAFASCKRAFGYPRGPVCGQQCRCSQLVERMRRLDQGGGQEQGGGDGEAALQANDGRAADLVMTGMAADPPGPIGKSSTAVGIGVSGGATSSSRAVTVSNYLVLAHIPERRDKPAWRRRWKSSTSKG